MTVEKTSNFVSFRQDGYCLFHCRENKCICNQMNMLLVEFFFALDRWYSNGEQAK